MGTMDSPSNFAEEIDFQELRFQEIVGRGAFGIVSHAKWRGIDVAVKMIETDAEKKAFILELKSLSRVDHPNIVKLYGACTSTKSPVCLVMEYAEGGSLYNVLHGSESPSYTAAHAISWAFQCAKGVDYLHSMKPKAIIHRDLKPPNLLVVNGGTMLKICDFGTACDIQTHMTNNKGSAAWMAPEVFEGCNYSEKCDVFSWGIILWEVLTRKKPFNEIGGSAFRIMWQVHNGTRPPRIQDIPEPLDTLMTKCWSAVPPERPSMNEVARIMGHMMSFFHGEDERLIYPEQEHDQPEYLFDTPPPTHGDTRHTTMRDTVREALIRGQGELVPTMATPRPRSTPVVVEDTDARRTSAPASLAASRESLLEKPSSRSSTPVDIKQKRYSADLSTLDEKDYQHFGENNASSHSSKKGHRRTGSHGNTPFVPVDSSSPSVGLSHVSTAPADLANVLQVSQPDQLNVNSAPLRSVSWTPGEDGVQNAANQSVMVDRRYSHGDEPEYYNPFNPVSPMEQGSPAYDSSAAIVANLALAAMDHQLQPLAPYPDSQESMDLFHEHSRLAQEYLTMQTEIDLLSQRRHDLKQELHRYDQEQQENERFIKEFTQLTNDNEDLLLLHSNLLKQVEVQRDKQRQKNYPGS